MKALIFLSLFSQLAFSFSGKKEVPIPDHVENKVFDAQKAPIDDEPKIEAALATSEWAKEKQKPLPSCEKHNVWKLVGRPNVSATAYKNRTAPVKGRFDRLKLLLVGTGEDEVEKGVGVIDLSSWNSDNLARDRRVQRYIFGVEEAGNALAKVEFSFSDWKKKGTWTTKATIEVVLRKENYLIESPVRISRTGNKLKIQSTKGAKLTFLKNEHMDSFQKLMERCNHQFLASFAEVEFSAAFKKVCK